VFWSFCVEGEDGMSSKIKTKREKIFNYYGFVNEKKLMIMLMGSS
jgi:hypothetical protein